MVLVTQHKHEDQAKYLRYHRSVYLPAHVARAAREFLPPALTPLKLSFHYREIQAERKLPIVLYMPLTYEIIDVTVVRDTRAIYRVMVRFHWNKRSDFAMVLEGDWELVTGFWQNPKDTHVTLDLTPYEKGEDEARRQSRPDDQT